RVLGTQTVETGFVGYGSMRSDSTGVLFLMSLANAQRVSDESRGFAPLRMTASGTLQDVPLLLSPLRGTVSWQAQFPGGRTRAVGVGGPQWTRVVLADGSLASAWS